MEPAEPQKTSVVAFGPFEYDCVSGDLRKFGTPIRLQGQPRQVLSILLERPGQVATREHLQNHLWPGATFVDFEQGLNAAINKLRQALGDSADQPRYVETAPGRGYRFIAPVRELNSPKPVLEMARPLPMPASEHRVPRRFLFWLAALVPIALGAYWLGTRIGLPGEPLKLTRFAVVPPAGYALEGAASRQSFELSPDGRRLAFTATAESGFHLFLRELGSVESIRLPETLGVHTTFWPPDGASLFLTTQGALRRTGLNGNSQVILSNTPNFLFSGLWLNQDRLLLSTYDSSYMVSLSSGTAEPTKTSYRWPQLLPDGKHILFISWDARALRFRVRVERLDDPGSARDLILSDSRALYTESQLFPGQGYLMYIRGGNLMAQPFDPDRLTLTGEPLLVANKVYSFFNTGAADFSVARRGTIAYTKYVSRTQLAWVDRAGRRLGTIGPQNINVRSGRLSPDGRHLVAALYNVERGHQDLWIFDLDTGTGRQLAAEPALRDAPVWSPDSHRLAYLHTDNNVMPLVQTRGLGENDLEKLTPSVKGSFNLPTDWSPDGRFVAVSTTGATRFESEAHGDVWMVDVAGGNKPHPILNSRFHEANAAFSPDGKWLAFTSNETGQAELYLQSFVSGESPTVSGKRHLVSRSGAVALRWRRDGKELFYLRFDGKVFGVPLRLSTRPTIGKPMPLFTIENEARSAIHSVLGFDVSSDGQRFVIPVVTSPESPSIIVVQNWEAELRGLGASSADAP